MRGGLTLGLFLLAAAPLRAADALELEIENGTSRSFEEIRLAPAGSGAFAYNALMADGGDPVEPGYTFTITAITPGIYDLRIAGTGLACTITGLDLSQSTAVIVEQTDGGGCSATRHPALHPPLQE